MGLLTIISWTEFTLITLFTFYVAYQLLIMWIQVREEALFHLMLFWFYFGIILMIINFLLAFKVPLALSLRDRAWLGVFYGGFYLELAFFYLSLFSNRRNLLEKYLIVFMTAVILINVWIGWQNDPALLKWGALINTLTILLGLYLLFQFYQRIRTSKQFATTPSLQEFLNSTQRLLLGAYVLLVLDGGGFLLWWFVEITVTEELYFFIASTAFFSLLVFFYYIQQLKRKIEQCDITEILNILS